MPDAPTNDEAAAAEPAPDGSGRAAPGLPEPAAQGFFGPAAPGFAGGAVLVLATAVYTQANLLFWLFGLGVGAAVFAAGHGWLAVRGLTVERLPPGRCAAGGPVTLGYRLGQRGAIACFGVRLRELDPGPRAGGLPWAWAPRVGPGEPTRVVARGSSPPRGEHALHTVEASTTFPLGLFRRRAVFACPGTLRVLPALVPLPPEDVFRAARPRPGPDGASARAAPGLEGDFYGSRAYRPGDPLRTLDWKRSARQGDLMVRELATPEPPRVAVLLLLGAATPGAPPTEAEAEAAISLAASLLTRAHAAGFRVGLHVAGAACPSFTPHHALAHRDRLLAALGRIDLSAGSPDREPEPPARTLREATAVICGGAGPEQTRTPGRPAATLRFASSPASRGRGRGPGRGRLGRRDSPGAAA